MRQKCDRCRNHHPSPNCADTLCKYSVGLLPFRNKDSNLAAQTTVGDLLSLKSKMLLQKVNRKMEKLM